MRKRLGDTLIGWGAISHADLEAALLAQAADSRLTRRRLGRVLLDQELIDEWTLASALADMHGLPAVDLTVEAVDATIARRVPQSVELQYLVLPLWLRDAVLRVAVADPLDVVAVDDLRVRMPGVRLEVVVAPESQVRERIQDVWHEAKSQEVMERFVSELPSDLPTSRDSVADDAGAVAAVHQILDMGARQGASDIHIEPLRDALIVRLRIDGQLRNSMSLPKSGQQTIVARMKIISGLDIVERRVPQDGRARFLIDGRERNLRVSTLPTINGEKIVVRLLSDEDQLPALTELGMPRASARAMRNALHLTQGLVLVTGPTGSGKSTTLYSAIREVVDSARNLITLEDPVEVELPGVTQVQINERVGMTFAAGLRASLRQDPDVIMVGEIRDHETAELAIRASLTGHLVLSTLHTIDAPSAITRLVEMGVAKYLVAAAMTLSMAQRLVRKPCTFCVGPAQADPDTARRLSLSHRQAQSLVIGKGCAECEGTGYRGRTGIYEVLQVTEPVRDAMVTGNGVDDLIRAAGPTGYRSLNQEGLTAAMEGRTTAAELLRVLNANTEDLAGDDL